MRNMSTTLMLRWAVFLVFFITLIWILYNWFTADSEISSRVYGIKKVRLDVFGESQCPDTSMFIQGQLQPLYEAGLGEYINFAYYPFGKAKCMGSADAPGGYQCDCQHGKTECDVNILQNCVINAYPQAKDYVPLVACLQGNSGAGKCFDSLSEKSTIQDCAASHLGLHLMVKAGERTASMAKGLNYVPWVIIDGERDFQMVYNLGRYICKKITVKPIACRKYLTVEKP